ncbi:beta-1,6-N-acetylglucosaminyltransferase [Sphingobacterium deserti]|uniref:Peptide O-xylosyltransferase n=1 Tax=Sphingobacterium deserti TaxID=1229276 RepID=A0A0B8T8B9_9SPHI|nr:beta-1,6-N-acetylglucosaminyltransferase [Sphingobacterium deserti]KGE14155.1 putative glycosyltransferase [Sphingobacterium deserti]
MKHAYLILAHHEFELLGYLLEALDDPRNTVFIHFDKKVAVLPVLRTSFANVIILEERVDVRWGDVSIVAAELLLFQTAQNHGKYSHYHLLSGVDMPLQTQDVIHSFCAKHANKQFIGYSQGDQKAHIERKVQRYHLFPKHFRTSGNMGDKLRKILRFICLRLQIILDIKRNLDIEFKKGTQWLSLTDEFVAFLLAQKDDILKRYNYTFCADEIFVQTACWNSRFREQIYDMTHEGNGSQRFIQWRDNQLIDWEVKDFDTLQRSDLLFARKFTSRHNDLPAAILRKLKEADL